MIPGAANVATRVIERIHAEAPPVVPPVFSTGCGSEFFATKPVETIGFSSEYIAELVDLILDKTISGKIAKTVFAEMAQSGSAPAKIVKDLGLVQIQDEGAIRKVIDEVIAANPAQVAQYKAGKVQLFGFFVGQSMKAMQGKGNPEMINKILRETLG